MVASLKVARVNARPLFPKSLFSPAHVKRALRVVERELQKSMVAHIKASAFSQRAKARLAAAMKFEIGPRSVSLVTEDPAFTPLLKGRYKRQMTWLVKARAPIPIITDKGELIFRSATPKSMADGSWVHPGRPGTNIIDAARKDARSKAKAHVAKVLRKELSRMGGKWSR